MQKLAFTLFTAVWLALFLSIVLVADGQRSDPIKRALSQLSLEPTVAEINEDIGVEGQAGEFAFAINTSVIFTPPTRHTFLAFIANSHVVAESLLRHLIWTRGPPAYS